MMEYDVHTLLDLLTLVATAWVIYMLRFKLSDSYQHEQDTIQTYYVVRSCCAARYSSCRLCFDRWILRMATCQQLCLGCIVRSRYAVCLTLGSRFSAVGVQIIPCALLAGIAHPGTNHPLLFRVCLSPVPCCRPVL